MTITEYMLEDIVDRPLILDGTQINNWQNDGYVGTIYKFD